MHSPGGLHQQVSLSGPAGGGHHSGCKRLARLHTTDGGPAPPAPSTAVQRSEMGATTVDEGGVAAEQAETCAGHAGEAGRGASVKESEMPK